VTEGEGPRARYDRAVKALAEGDVEGHYRLALRLQEEGAPDLARRELLSVVRLDPDHLASRRALGQEKVDGEWVSREEAYRRRGLVLYGGRWLLPAEAEAAARATSAPTGPRVESDAALLAAMRTEATGPAALRRPARLAALEAGPERRFAAASLLLYDADPKVRVFAAGELSSIGDEDALRPLLLSGMRDRDPDVRRAAVLAAASFGHEDVAIPFVRALRSTHPSMVANAAKALALIGDDRAVVHIVKRITAHGGGGRSVIEELNKVTYVRDYDVEIAQAANIANPEIGIVQEGIVLDAKVLDLGTERTVVETVLLDALNSLAGTRLASRDDVIAWYRENGSRLRDFPSEGGRRRASRATAADR
jgi:hypothetical protein